MQQTAVVGKYELDALCRLEDKAVTWSDSICDSQIWVNICSLESIYTLPEEAEASYESLDVLQLSVIAGYTSTNVG